LAEEQERYLGWLKERLLEEGADLDGLAEVRVAAQVAAESRGVADVEAVDGPVGAAVLADVFVLGAHYSGDDDEWARRKWGVEEDIS
jgi:hypothetical protein